MALPHFVDEPTAFEKRVGRERIGEFVGQRQPHVELPRQRRTDWFDAEKRQIVGLDPSRVRNGLGANERRPDEALDQTGLRGSGRFGSTGLMGSTVLIATLASKACSTARFNA